MEQFILGEMDKAWLGHNTFTDEALALIVRSCDGIIRRARNLCLSCLLEGVRDRQKTLPKDRNREPHPYSAALAE